MSRNTSTSVRWFTTIISLSLYCQPLFLFNNHLGAAVAFFFVENISRVQRLSFCYFSRFSSASSDIAMWFLYTVEAYIYQLQEYVLWWVGVKTTHCHEIPCVCMRAYLWCNVVELGKSICVHTYDDRISLANPKGVLNVEMTSATRTFNAQILYTKRV